jgi:hypothetical protein
VSDQVIHPYRTTGKIILLYIVIFKYFDSCEELLAHSYNITNFWIAVRSYWTHSCNITNFWIAVRSYWTHPITLQITMKKSQWIGHSPRKEDGPLKNKHWIGIRRQPEGEEDRSKPGKGPFWRQQKNGAKHGGYENGGQQGQMETVRKWPVFEMEVKDMRQVFLCCGDM